MASRMVKLLSGVLLSIILIVVLVASILFWNMQTVASTRQTLILDAGPAALVMTPAMTSTIHFSSSSTVYLTVPGGAKTQFRQLVSSKRAAVQVGLGSADLSLWILR